VLPVAAVAVKTTLLPTQKVRGPLAVTALLGNGFTVTAIVFEVSKHKPALNTMA
jgi:hypothetical protein